MIIDTHTHVVSSDKVKHPLDPGARGWSTEVSNDVEDLIAEMDQAGVECATLVQPSGTYALDNSYQCDSAQQYAPRTVSVGILDPAAPDAADKLSYWVNERGMVGVRLQSDAEPDDPRCDALWQRAEALGIPISIGGGGQPEEGQPDAERGRPPPQRTLCPRPLRWLERRRRQGRYDGRTGRPGQVAQCPPAYFQHQPRPLRQPDPAREGPLQAGNRGLHATACHVGLQLPLFPRRRLHRPGAARPDGPGPGSPTTTVIGLWARPPTSSGRCCKGHPGGRLPSGLPPDSPSASTADW